MKAEILKLGRNGLYYGIAMVASKAAGFLMLPIYTRYLTPADYGVAELLMTTVDVISMIAGLGITAAIFKVRADYKTEEERNRVFSTALSLLFVFGAASAALGLFFSAPLSRLVFGHTDFADFFRIVFVTFFLQQGLIAVPLMFIRARENARLFMAIGLTKLALQLTLNITLLVILDMGLVGILLSGMLAELIMSVYLVAHIGRESGFAFDRDKARALLGFGYPFVFTSLGSFALVFADRYFLNAYADLPTIGIYALAYKLGFMLVFLAVTPFQQVWEPQRFRIAETPAAAATFQRVFVYLNILLLGIGLALALFAREILYVMSDPAYWPAQYFVPLVVLAYVFHTWTFFCDFGLQKTGRSGRIAQVSVVSAGIILLLLTWWVPQFGAYGALSALIVTYVVRFALVYRLSQRAYPLDYGLSKALPLLAIAIALGAFGVVAGNYPLPMAIAYKLSLLLLFVVTAYTLFLTPGERRFIQAFIKRPAFPKPNA